MGDEQVCAELVEAFSEGDAEDARALLKKHPHLSDYVDPETQGTLLQIAALRGHSDCVEAALEAGADHEITHPVYGMTPFLWACSEAHLMCVQQLVRAGCNKKSTWVMKLLPGMEALAVGEALEPRDGCTVRVKLARSNTNTIRAIYARICTKFSNCCIILEYHRSGCTSLRSAYTKFSTLSYTRVRARTVCTRDHALED